jgi:hypothetical protein
MDVSPTSYFPHIPTAISLNSIVVKGDTAEWHVLKAQVTVDWAVAENIHEFLREMWSPAAPGGGVKRDLERQLRRIRW